MDKSIFTDKDQIPDGFTLAEALGNLNKVWMEIRDYAFMVYPRAIEEWNFPGQKYGWNFRIKDKKRAIIYLLPRDKYFLVAFVFGAKATSQALASTMSNDLKIIIESARVYAEGRGFRIEVRNETILEEIKKLIDIKVVN
jgi:hypothetical protein